MANYETLKAAIDAVIKANGQREITGTVLNQTLNAMVNSLGANYQLAGVATPSTNPGTPDQNVFYLAFEAGTYTNFNATVLSAGISILMWNGSWSSQTFYTIDSTPTASSNNLISSGAVFDAIKTDGGAYDVSAHFPTGGPNSDGKFTLEYILSNANTLIPEAWRKGGMSIRFVSSSDNKYVQYRLMHPLDNASTAAADFANTANWQGVTNEVKSGSKDLIESGSLFPIKTKAEGNLGDVLTSTDYFAPGSDVHTMFNTRLYKGDIIKMTFSGEYVWSRLIVSDTSNTNIIVDSTVQSIEKNVEYTFVLEHDYTDIKVNTVPYNESSGNLTVQLEIVNRINIRKDEIETLTDYTSYVYVPIEFEHKYWKITNNPPSWSGTASSFNTAIIPIKKGDVIVSNTEYASSSVGFPLLNSSQDIAIKLLSRNELHVGYQITQEDISDGAAYAVVTYVPTSQVEPIVIKRHRFVQSVIDDLSFLDGYIYKGIASLSTVPVSPTGKEFYFAKEIGTYTNFSNCELKNGIGVLTYNGTAWTIANIADKLVEDYIDRTSIYYVPTEFEHKWWYAAGSEWRENQDFNTAIIPIIAGDVVISNTEYSSSAAGFPLLNSTQTTAIKNLTKTQLNQGYTVTQEDVNNGAVYAIVTYKPNEQVETIVIRRARSIKKVIAEIQDELQQDIERIDGSITTINGQVAVLNANNRIIYDHSGDDGINKYWNKNNGSWSGTWAEVKSVIIPIYENDIIISNTEFNSSAARFPLIGNSKDKAVKLLTKAELNAGYQVTSEDIAGGAVYAVVSWKIGGDDAQVNPIVVNIKRLVKEEVINSEDYIYLPTAEELDSTRKYWNKVTDKWVNNDLVRTAIIPIAEGDVVICNTEYNSAAVGFPLLDNSQVTAVKLLTITEVNNGYEITNADILNGATYAVVTYHSTDQVNPISIKRIRSVKQSVIQMKESLPLYGKNIIMLGDSTVGSINPLKTFVTNVENKTGAKVYTGGFGGCRYAWRTADGSNQYDVFSGVDVADTLATKNFTTMESTIPNLPDPDHVARYTVSMNNLKQAVSIIGEGENTVITICYGENDFQGKNELGDTTSPYDKQTVLGAMQYMIETIMTAYPKVKIIIVSPTYRAFSEGGEITGDSDDDAAKLEIPTGSGTYYSRLDYVDAILDCANDNHIKGFDMYRRGGRNKYNITSITTDGMHYNTAYGVQFISDCYVKMLNGF